MDVSTSVSIHVDLQNEILCDKQESQLLLFRIQEISGGENLLWKPASAMEISRNPSKYLPCCYLFFLIMYLIIQYFIIGMHFLVFSPFSQPIYIYIYWLTMKFRFPYANQFLRIQVKRQQLSTLSLLLVTVTANQLINWSSVSFRRIQVWATGE